MQPSSMGGVLKQSFGNTTSVGIKARATSPTPRGGGLEVEELGEASKQLLSRRGNELRDRRGKVGNATISYTSHPM